jgi:hypothetical protein
VIDSLETILRAITKLDNDIAQVIAIFDRYLDGRGAPRTRADFEHRQRGEIARLRMVMVEFHGKLMQAFADREKHATIDVGAEMRQILSDVTPDGVVGRSVLADLAKINTRT